MSQEATNLQIKWIDTRSDSAMDDLQDLRQTLSAKGNVVSEASRQKTIDVFGRAMAPNDVVETICRDVAERGSEAVRHYTEKLDGRQLSPEALRVPVDQIAAAHAQAEPEFLATIRAIRERLLEFQNQIVPKSHIVQPRPGVQLEHRYVPLTRVGICVPGGAAAYPSTVLMTAVPAQAAGVGQLVVVAPPTKYGSENPDVLTVCHELGIDAVYRMGGAQAVAALAYGLDCLDPVDKIVGPGNLFVALAKKFVFGEVDIDAIAGPSEVVVIADDTVDPDWVAADLLAQAEHAPGVSLLISWQETVLNAVYESLNRRIETLDRADVTRESLESYGRLILVQDRDQACELATEIAPEHLHLESDGARQLLENIPTAGAVFVGRFSPVPLGDYIAGPSHVLPTGGTARFASGLSAASFVRSHSVIEYSQDALVAEADWVGRIAEKEELTAHRDSIVCRIPKS